MKKGRLFCISLSNALKIMMAFRERFKFPSHISIGQKKKENEEMRY